MNFFTHKTICDNELGNKRKTKLEKLWSIPKQPENNHNNTNNDIIHVETVVERVFKCTTGDDLSYIVSSNSEPEIETITATHLLFQCPVCLEEDKLVDVILQCRHCVCRNCHEFMLKDGQIYLCPICRRDMTIVDRQQGPTLHYMG